MNLMEFVDEVNNKVEELLQDECEEVNAKVLGLDYRAGTVWVCEDYIAVDDRNLRMLSYYGGFEYVDSEYVTKVGSYTIFSAEHNRVADAIDAWVMTHHEEEEV